jgi:hypothetical protein
MSLKVVGCSARYEIPFFKGTDRLSTAFTDNFILSPFSAVHMFAIIQQNK